MLMTASNQWASRPADQRVTSLDELLAFTRRQREISHADVVASRRIQTVPGRLDPRERTVKPRCGSGLAVPAC